MQLLCSLHQFERCDNGNMWKSNGRGSAGLNCMAQAFRLKYLFKLPEGTSFSAHLEASTGPTSYCSWDTEKGKTSSDNLTH